MTVRCVPVERFDLAGRTKWYESLALEGLYPSSGYWWPLYFLKKGEAQRLRYALEPVRKRKKPEPDLKLGEADPDGPDAALMELYEASGWRYVCKDVDFYLFSTADPAAPEPYSDEDSRAESMAALDRRLRRSALCGIGILVIFALMLVLVYRTSSARLSMLLAVIPLTYSVMFVVGFIDSVRVWRSIHRLRVGLREGGVLPPTPPRRPGAVKRWHEIYQVMLCIFLAAIVSFFLFNHFPPSIKNGGAYPILAQIEQRSDLKGQSDYPDRYGREEDGAKVMGVSALVPVQVEATETLYGPLTEGDSAEHAVYGGGWYRYAPELQSRYFYLTIPAMARAIAEAQLDVFHTINQFWEFKEGSCPGADFVILGYADGSNQCELAAIASGHRLVVYSYWGDENLADRLDVLAGPVLK